MANRMKTAYTCQRVGYCSTVDATRVCDDSIMSHTLLSSLHDVLSSTNVQKTFTTALKTHTPIAIGYAAACSSAAKMHEVNGC